MLRGIQKPTFGLNRLWLLLCVANVTTRESVEGAVAVIRELHADRSAIKRMRKKSRSKPGRVALADCLNRVERQLRRWESILKRDLGVTTRSFVAGEPFDPEFHEVVETIQKPVPSHHNTIHPEVEPLLAFTYRDEFGRDQVIPAKVRLFVSKANGEKVGEDDSF
jgi:hypothetical protein